VEELCRSVEEISGKPVIVRADPNLKLITNLAVARETAPAHVISFNPKYRETADYSIAFQCGLLLRIFRTPPEDRFDLATTGVGRQEVGMLLKAQLRKSDIKLAELQRHRLRDQVYDGLILQLRSVPAGLRVDAWIRETYPALAEQQRISAARQLAENLGALSPKVKELAPGKVYRANIAMNAALALFFARLLGDPTAALPYRVGGTVAVGEQLLALADSRPSEPEEDRGLIEAWGALLNLAGWYSFVPFGG